MLVFRFRIQTCVDCLIFQGLSGATRKYHYCFRKRYDKATIRSRLERLLAENSGLIGRAEKEALNMDEVVSILVGFMERFEENDAESFGVGVMWVDSYDEIPSLLKKIRVAG